MYVYIPTTLKINHSNHKINHYILSSTHRIHTRDATPLQRVFARLILLQPPFQILQFLQRHSLKKKKNVVSQSRRRWKLIGRRGESKWQNPTGTWSACNQSIRIPGYRDVISFASFEYKSFRELHDTICTRACAPQTCKPVYIHREIQGAQLDPAVAGASRSWNCHVNLP